MGDYQFEINPAVKKELERKRKTKKAVTIFWIAFAVIAILAIILNIGTDAYRHAKKFDGAYIRWYELWSSDALEFVGYDTYHDKLAVVFESSDTVYVYSGVSSSVAEHLRESDSPGEYYNDVVKGQYPSEKIYGKSSFIDKSIFDIKRIY